MPMVLRSLQAAQLGRGNMATGAGTIFWGVSLSLLTLLMFQCGGVPGSFALGYTKI